MLRSRDPQPTVTIEGPPDDLPLRDDETPLLDIDEPRVHVDAQRPMFGAAPGAPPVVALSGPPRGPDTGRATAFVAIAAAMAGLVLGAAGGFVLGQRSVPRAVQPSPDTQAFTDAPVAQPTPVVEEPVVPEPTQEPSPAPTPSPRLRRSAEAPRDRGRTGATTPAPPVAVATNRTDRGSMQVLSRPAGANVFVDGRLIGRTPLVVPDVAPGSHAIRLELSGHLRWQTTATVIPGERLRVAGSLEPN